MPTLRGADSNYNARLATPRHAPDTCRPGWMNPMTDTVSPTGLRHFSKLTAASTLFLIFAGAMVTSTDSGLAVPDWPLSFGQVMPPMVGGIFYEHGHRMIATLVGFFVLVQAFWLQAREPRRFVRILGWVALLMVIFQGVLGGLTVLFLLPPAISVAHAALAQIFLCLTLAIAFYCSRSYAVLLRLRPAATDMRVSSLILVGLIFLQTVLGAIMRHLGAGLAIPDFPLAFGRLVPELATLAITINYAHRVGAVAVLLMMILMTARAFRARSAAHTITFGVLLIVLGFQITLGAMTVWSLKQPVITSLHVVTGATMLGLSFVYALVSSVTAPGIDRAEMSPAARAGALA
jgi:heme a synthase